MTAKHDHLIEEIVNDSRYYVFESGRIFKGAKEVGFTKKTEKKLRKKNYRYIKYKGVEIKIHRIIYRLYNGKLDRDMVVHHIDGNGLNNDYRNLELVTPSLNNYFK